MRIRPDALPLVVFAALTTAYSPTAAQNSVPMELVRALLGRRATANVVVGRVPDGFPTEVIPAGARVVGGYGSSDELAAHTVAVVAVPQPPREARPALRTALTPAGWADPRTGRQPSGFVSSTSEPASLLCRGNETLYYSVMPRQEGGSYLRLDHTRVTSQGYSPCSAPQERRVPEGQELPMLTSPEGVVASNTGISTSFPDGVQESRARLLTTMPPAELLAHFAAQLREAGWTASPATAGSDAGSQTFRKRDPAGKELFGLLTAVAYPDSNARDLAFRQVPLPLSANR